MRRLASLVSSLCLAAAVTVADEPSAVDMWLDAHLGGLLDAYVHLHRHPELSLEERETAAFLAARLRAAGFTVTEGVGGHGIVAVLDNGTGPTVLLRADLDALPVTERTGLPHASTKTATAADGTTVGVMHACGHDVHMTKNRDCFSGTVKFLFQPAEEGMPVTYKQDWGAKLMVAEGAMENPRPAAVFALHCRPTIVPMGGSLEATRYLEAGQLSYAVGADSANSDTFEVVIKGKMAHGSAPQRGVDAITVAAEAITALQTIRSRRTDTRQPLVLTIGTIQGGQRHNILADEVRFTGTLRTYDEAFRDEVVKMMDQILDGITAAHGASHVFDFRKGYPGVYNDPALVKATLPTLRRIAGEANVIESLPGMGGEDFSHFAKVVPGFYFRLGVADEAKGIKGEIHTPGFDVDEECLKTGVAAMAGVLCDFLDAAK